MNDRLRALQLVLNEIDVDFKIDGVDDRLVLQKALYLVQKDLNLGYSYGWYLKGPYSPGLTRDYYELAAIPDREDDLGTLKQNVREVLANTKGLIQAKPDNVSLANWLELLASLHYLRVRSRLDTNSTREKIAETKPHLNELVDQGLQTLSL